MIVKNANIVVYSTCNQVLSLFKDSEKLRRATNEVVNIVNGKLVVKIRGEAKIREIALNMKKEESGSTLRIEGYNDLGLHALTLEVSCRDIEDLTPKASVNISIILNPVALQVSHNLCNIASIHMLYDLDRRLNTLVREVMKPHDRLHELLRGDVVAQAIAKGDVVTRFRSVAKEVNLIELIKKYNISSAMVSASDEMVDLKMVVVGSLYAATLKIGELEYKDEEALRRFSQLDKEVNVTLYNIERIMKTLR